MKYGIKLESLQLRHCIALFYRYKYRHLRAFSVVQSFLRTHSIRDELRPLLPACNVTVFLCFIYISCVHVDTSPGMAATALENCLPGANNSMPTSSTILSKKGGLMSNFQGMREIWYLLQCF